MSVKRGEDQYSNVINKLVPKKDHERIRKLLKANHSSAMGALENFGVICFRWNLETDLMSSGVAANLMFDSLKLLNADRSTKFALEKREKEIGKAEHLVKVVSNLEKSNLPNSYKRVQRMLTGIQKGILEQQRAIASAAKIAMTKEPDEEPVEDFDEFDMDDF